MKRIFTILLSVVISSTIMGQQTPEKHQRLKNTKDIKQRLDSVIKDEYDFDAGQWDGVSEKYEYTYDANGNATLHIIYKWNESTSHWYEYGKKEYSYDGNGNMITYIDYNMNETTGQWIENDKEEYSYDGNEVMSMYVKYDWDETTSQWIVDRKTEYTYDDNGKITLEIGYNWNENPNQWIENRKTEYTYDDNGIITLEIGYDWDTSTSLWDVDWKGEYTFDDDMNITSYIFYNWDESTSQWNVYSKREYIYDINGNMTQDHEYGWDESTSQYIEYGNYVYTYDLAFDFSDLILPPSYWPSDESPENIINMPVSITQNDEFENDTWYPDWKRTNYYSEVSVGISEPIFEKDINVFPNPAAEFIEFDITNIAASATIEMFNIQGKKVLSQKFSDNKQITVSHLTKGLYMYKLNTNGQTYSGKIMIE